MTVPAQFQPGGEKGAPVGEGERVPAEQAFASIESMIQSPRGQAALKTLRAELESGGGSPARKPGSTTDAKQEALRRLKG